MNPAGSGFGGVLVILAVAGCSSSDDSGGSTSSPAAAAENAPSAAPSVCAESGKAPTANQATCDEKISPATVADADKDGFCRDKRFGTFFFASDGLYFCGSPTQARSFPFGEQYAEAIVIKTDSDILGFAHGSANNYRCYQQNGVTGNKQQIDNRSASLKLNEELCGTGITGVATNPTKITYGGHTYQLVSLQ